MTLSLITAPVTEPVTLAEAKAQARAPSGSAEDAMFTIWIKAARLQAEHYTGRVFLPQTWQLALDAFPADEIVLGMAPVASVTSIKYTDTAGAEQTISSGNYVLDTAATPGVVRLAYGANWPTPRDEANAVRVRFVAGYADANADALVSLRHWMLLAVAAAYRNRESFVEGTKPEEVPRMAGIGLLDSLRTFY